MTTDPVRCFSQGRDPLTDFGPNHRRVPFVAALPLITLLSTADSAGNELVSYGWSHRPVIIYAPSPDMSELQNQRQAFLSINEELEEREIVLIEVVGEVVRTLVGPSVDSPMDGNARALRRQHGISKDAFAVVLVGKDGGMKLRSFEHVSAAQLFGLIDAMPMRQREMNERAGK